MQELLNLDSVFFTFSLKDLKAKEVLESVMWVLKAGSDAE